MVEDGGDGGEVLCVLCGVVDPCGVVVGVDSVGAGEEIARQRHYPCCALVSVDGMAEHGGLLLWVARYGVGGDWAAVVVDRCEECGIGVVNKCDLGQIGNDG